MEEELIVENSDNAKEQQIFNEANIPQQTRKYCIFQADSLLNWLVGWIRLVIFTFSLFIFATSVVSLNRLAIGNEDLVVFNATISSEKNENATLQYFVVDATDAPFEYEIFWYGWRLAFDLIISGLICLDSVIVLVNKLGTRWRRLSEGGVRDRLYTHFPKSTLEYLASWSGLTYQVFRFILHVLLASAYSCTNYTSALLYFTTVADGFYMGRWIILALSGAVFLLSFLHHPWLNRKNEPLARAFARAKEGLTEYFKWDKNNFKRDATRLANHLILSSWLVLWGITYVIVVASQERLCGDYVEIVNMILKLGVMIFYLLHSFSLLGNSSAPIHPLNSWLFLYTVAQLVPEYNVSRDEVLTLIGLVQIIGLLCFGVYQILFFWQYDTWKHKRAKTNHEEEKVESDHKIRKINKPREIIARITSAAAFVLIVPGLFLAVIGLFQPWYELDFEWNVAIPDLLDLTIDVEDFFDPLMDALGIFESIFNTEVVCPIFYGASAVVLGCTLSPYPCPGVSIARDLASKAVDLKKLARRALWLKNRFVKIVRTAVRLRSLIPRNLPVTSIAPLTEKYFFLVFLVVTPVFTSVAGIAIAFWYRRGNRGKWINWVLGAIAMLIINVLSLILNFAIPYIIDEIVGEIPLISVRLIRLPGFYMVIASHVLVIIAVVLFLISTLVAEEGDYSDKFGGNVLVQKQAKLATLQSSKVHNKYLTRTKLATKIVYRRIQLLPLSWLLSVSVVVFGTVIGTIPLQSDLFTSEYNPLNQVIQVNQTLTEIEEMLSAFKSTLDDISPPCPLIPLEYIFKAAVTLFDEIPNILNDFDEAVLKVIALFNIPFRVLSRTFNLLFVAAPIFNCVIIVIGWFGATTGEQTQQKTAYMIGKITIMSLQMVMTIYQIVGTVVNNIPLLSTIFAIKSAYLYAIVAHVFSLFATVFLMSILLPHHNMIDLQKSNLMHHQNK